MKLTKSNGDKGKGNSSSSKIGKICVSIPADTPEALKTSIGYALDQGADIIEVRFDYTSKDMVSDILYSINDQKDSMIFTCRRRDEGGKYDGSEHDRVSIIKRLASFRPMLVDVEYNTLLENDELHDQLRALNADLLVSYHNFKETPSLDNMLDTLNEISKRYSNNIKIVTMANSLDDNIKILSLYKHITNNNNNNTNLIAFCMGEYGIASRVLCTLLGSPFTYASLKDALAPGQLTIKQMRFIYEQIRYISIDTGYISNELLRLIEVAKGVR
jgi:3-dehydroquinate dehydratase, type I